MLSDLVTRLSILPRWIIIIIDLVIVAFAASISYLIRFNFNWNEVRQFNPSLGLAVIIVSSFVAITITKSYKGIVRYTGIEDGIRVLKTSFLTLLILLVTNLLVYYNVSKNLIPYSVVLTTFFVSFLFLFFYRLLVKNIFSYYLSDVSDAKRVMIFGAGQSGLITKQVMDSDLRSNYKVMGFIDDDIHKAGNIINGAPIYSSNVDWIKLLQLNRVNELVISVRDLPVERTNEIVDTCLKAYVKVRTVPPVEKWVKGELSIKQIKEVKIENLLGRETIKLNNTLIQEEISGKVICITGAAGSIGSELARQVSSYNPSVLVLVDQAESPLYEIERELRDRFLACKIHVFVADICNRDRMEYFFREFKPEIVFHAAAYKHVPMMESNPAEAVMCNILGTRSLADLSMQYQVRKFVMISTDKSVNPTSVMGCSKRIAEIYVQSLNNHYEALGSAHTSFVTTRFGNVLGSNGSVIPFFKKQIDAGGPLTVTHPEITRYFMTIAEACQLVLEAGVMGRGGEIFIFDMGKPVRIYELAKKMVMLSGLELEKDINIVFTGLREGEKLYEELLNDKENTIPTHHEKILKAKVAEYPYNDIDNLVHLLSELVNDRNELKMVALMKEIVPEFKSNYSKYEILDRGTS